MDWDFIIQCILAAGLSAALLALLDARLKLREEKRKTSMFYSISKDLEGDTWKQKDVIEEQSGTIVEQKSTIREQEGTIKVQNNTILEQKHEIESLETDLEESRTMARMLLQRGRENTELTAFTEKLLMLADETANIYYESASSPGNMSRRIRDILHKELADTDILPSINSLIEASYPGFTESSTSGRPVWADRWTCPSGSPNTSRTGCPHTAPVPSRKTQKLPLRHRHTSAANRTRTRNSFGM